MGLYGATEELTGPQEGKEYKTLFRSPLSSPCCHDLRPPHFPAPTPKQPPVLTASSKGTKTISSVPTDTHLAMAPIPIWSGNAHSTRGHNWHMRGEAQHWAAAELEGEHGQGVPSAPQLPLRAPVMQPLIEISLHKAPLQGLTPGPPGDQFVLPCNKNLIKLAMPPRTALKLDAAIGLLHTHCATGSREKPCSSSTMGSGQGYGVDTGQGCADGQAWAR